MPLSTRDKFILLALLLACTAYTRAAGPEHSARAGPPAAVVREPALAALSYSPALATLRTAYPTVPRGAPEPATAPRLGRVITLPPGPGSLTLVLSALLAVGAHQGTRALGRLHASQCLPEWYHAGAPLQIGHVKRLALDVIDLDGELAVALPDTTTLARPTRARPLPPESQIVPNRAPRSPPRHSPR